VNSVKVFPTISNCSKQSGVIGNKRWSCVGRYEVLQSSFGGCSIVVNTSAEVVRGQEIFWDGQGSRPPNDSLTTY